MLAAVPVTGVATRMLSIRSLPYCCAGIANSALAPPHNLAVLPLSVTDALAHTCATRDLVIPSCPFTSLYRQGAPAPQREFAAAETVASAR